VARERLSELSRDVREQNDVYELPSPEQTVVLSLGYRAALADLIYGHVLVSYGLHFQDKRLFEFVGSYLDTINALDPKFREPYLFADTLLTLQPQVPPQAYYEKAREILLRGTRELPYDALLHSSAGQYLAYLISPRMDDPKRKQQWRMEGARLLMRACELQGQNTNVSHNCISAAGILNRAGEHQANIQFLQRFLVVNDDPEIRQQALSYLGKALKGRDQERFSLRSRACDQVWLDDLPHVNKDALLVIGPRFDAGQCSYGAEQQRDRCRTAWRGWGDD
jgi:hypothetical protein